MIDSGKSHLVVTADTAGIAQAQEDSELLALYQSADLATPDSYGVIWALSRRGRKQERVTGVDLVDRLCHLSSQTGARIFILGSAPGVAEIAAENLRLRHPGCQIVGTRHGYFPREDDALVAEEIAPFNPDILFVAMGIPRQEKFIAATQSIIKARVAVGVGGSFDVYSGRAKRAPALIQKLRLEWLWRLILNPKKISKAQNLPKFVMMELRRRK
jgi:N-acetylglucosaminyldiphosphoundecaprenol N-acetyl-beta-D-mannosaminyltransferase